MTIRSHWLDEVFQGGVHGADKRLLEHEKFKQAVIKAAEAYRNAEKLLTQSGYDGPTAPQSARTAFLDELISWGSLQAPEGGGDLEDERR